MHERLTLQACSGTRHLSADGVSIFAERGEGEGIREAGVHLNPGWRVWLSRLHFPGV